VELGSKGGGFTCNSRRSSGKISCRLKVGSAVSITLIILSPPLPFVCILFNLPTGVPGAIVIGATVPGAIVIGATVPGAIVIGATVPGAIVIGATVPGATVIGATVPGAIVIGATVPGAIVIGATVPGGSVAGALVFNNVAHNPLEQKIHPSTAPEQSASKTHPRLHLICPEVMLVGANVTGGPVPLNELVGLCVPFTGVNVAITGTNVVGGNVVGGSGVGSTVTLTGAEDVGNTVTDEGAVVFGA
jgi:hypothetical protein